MKIETLDSKQALAEGAKLPFVMLQTVSAVVFAKNPYTIEETEINEARFFDEQTEIRIFRQDGELQAVCLTEEASDRCIKETYEFANKVLGKELEICRVLDTDEDGQTYITATRLTGWKGEA